MEGFKAYTPGHASHHVSYLHVDTGDVYVGDTAGVRILPHEHTVAPTPPPDIDIEAWLDSLHAIARVEPDRALPHPLRPGDRRRGPAPPRARVARGARGHRPAAARRTSGGAMDREVRDATGAEAAERFTQAVPPEQAFQGLERYWRAGGGGRGSPQAPPSSSPRRRTPAAGWAAIGG